MAALLDEAKDRHFITWPILGVVLWANPQPVATDYAGEISNMKNWLQQRLTWLDANMPGICSATGNNELSDADNNLSIYPNPFTDKLKISFNLETVGPFQIEINDLLGRKVFIQSFEFNSAGKQDIQLNSLKINPGVYVIRVIKNQTIFSEKLICR